MADNLNGCVWLLCADWTAGRRGWQQEPIAVIQRRGNEGPDYVERVAEGKSGQIMDIFKTGAKGFVNILHVMCEKSGPRSNRKNEFPTF